MTGQRALAGLGVLWAGWLFDGVTNQPDRTAALVFAVFGVAWVLASVGLLIVQDERFPASVCIGLCALQLLGAPGSSYSPVVLLLWVSIIVASTRGHPVERALLIRVCVTCVYLFAAASKLNPAWLAGEQLRGLVATRAHLEVFRDLVDSGLLPILVLLPILIESGVGLALWFRRSRWFAVAVGLVFHLGLVYSAGFFKAESLLYLAVLNFGLVALYPNFWTPVSLRPASQPDVSTDAGSGGGAHT